MGNGLITPSEDLKISQGVHVKDINPAVCMANFDVSAPPRAIWSDEEGGYVRVGCGQR